MQHYLDNSATTRVRETVSNKVVKLMTENFGNPSSLHTLGIRAEDELEKARETVDGFKDKDISGFSISYEFGGRGEDLAEQGTVLEKIYGEKIAGDLFVALDNGDEDSVKRLLPKHSDEAVTALLSFLDNYEGMADLTYTLNEEGKLDLEISDDVY